MTVPSIERDTYRSHPLAVRAQQVMTRGNTRSTLFVPPSPPYAVSGDGALVTDQFGHEVIDCNNNYTSLIHGHAQREVISAVAPLLWDGTAFGLPTESEVQLAELLAARTGHERWRFSNSGTEAVMTAVRAARAFTGRDVLIRFEGSYHGTADSVVSLSAPGVPSGTRTDVVEVPQGDQQAFDSAVAAAGDRLAAVLIDLMPNRAGLVPADPAFAAHIREQTRRVGALMIVDEVITLRMALGGLAAAYGIDPDLITAGKIIGGGFPVGAVGGRAEVLAVFDPIAPQSVGWGGTFSANPVTMTAGRIAMELFDVDAVGALNAKGDSLRTALEQAGVAVSGSGSLTRVREAVDLGELWWAAYERGAMLGTNGLLALSTPMTDSNLETVERAIVGAVRALRGRKSP
jgi:glutamate-1-semialdehyde 2,1-aminomutase